MKNTIAAALYMALRLGAIPALADVDAAIAARDGDMKPLVFHTAPEAVTQLVADATPPLAGVFKFFDEIGVDNLPRHQDPKQKLAAQMGVFGLPITVLIDPEGREIARLRGDADWSSDSAKAVITALIEAEGS